MERTPDTEGPDVSILLAQISTLTGLIRSVWLTLMLGCGYSWLTLATMTDSMVKSDSISLVLPVLGTAIPPSGFLVFAPLAILVLFIYVHVNISRLWIFYRMLPPSIDGMAAEDRVAPWLMTSLMNQSGAPRRPFRLIGWMSALALGWIVPPVTIFALGGRYISPSWFELFYHSALIAIAIVITCRSAWFVFWSSART